MCVDHVLLHQNINLKCYRLRDLNLVGNMLLTFPDREQWKEVNNNTENEKNILNDFFFLLMIIYGGN